LAVLPNGFGTMNFTATLSADVTGTLAANSPQGVTLAALGQSAQLALNAPGGQSVTLDFSAFTTSPAGGQVLIYAFNSSGAQINGFSLSAASGSFGLGTLSAGAYSILVEPLTPVTSAMQVTYH
jgi:hypothetical protein